MSVMVKAAEADAIIDEVLGRVRLVELAAEVETKSTDVGNWRDWLATYFPAYVAMGFASYHVDYWNWMWTLNPGEPAAPFVGIWPRGYGKSTSVELGVAACAASRSRRYVLYVCETQDQADTHVQNIAGLLESPAFAKQYPAVSRRQIGKYGNPMGWRRNRLRTASGFTVDALGLDTAARGAKVDEVRPDLIVLDDIDGPLDGPSVIARKVTTITKTVIPMRAEHAAVLAVQNLVHPEGVFARLAGTAKEKADFLVNRIVSGPHPAIEQMTYEARDGKTVITGGTPTWPAMDLAACQTEMDEMGLTAYLAEKQNKVEAPAGGMFDHLAFRHVEWSAVPDLTRIVVWVDPAVTDTDNSDSHGIQADGIAPNGDIYRLYSWEHRTSPLDVLKRALRKAVELKAECVGVETDQGGDTWASTYDSAWKALVEDEHEPGITDKTRRPTFRQEKAGAGHGPKAHRASLMLADYEKGRFWHVVGTHDVLERGLRRFPKSKPFDLVDAAYWAWHDLRRGSRKAMVR
jgi:hypothetical protein